MYTRVGDWADMGGIDETTFQNFITICQYNMGFYMVLILLRLPHTARADPRCKSCQLILLQTGHDYTQANQITPKLNRYDKTGQVCSQLQLI
jgi:hypothetical protein